MTRYVCVHGHFYQPPRENPWLEEIEIQDSAHPFHDWNDRITSECYAPNAVARILNEGGRIERLVNNYAHISFNFGPTLLSWLRAKHADIYGLILDADRQSADRFGGHGSAMAQVYNHAIMPLCDGRDQRTQVTWGVRDFEHRFGRRPEGMWLAETAVDIATLEVLAEHGIRFTILSPGQAARVRPSGSGEWHDVAGGRIDPTRAYRQRLPSGRHVDLFFYDPEIARGVAFGDTLEAGQRFADRLLAGFHDRDGAQLVHVATDGESYGHHQHHGDMALACALARVGQIDGVRLTNYGEFLERHPPEWDVEIIENTAWSCAHGVGRWKEDCGCKTGDPDWQQRWRGPLREALDWLRDVTRGPFEAAGAGLLRDPWAARDDYIGRALDGSDKALLNFIEGHAAREPSDGDTSLILKLMELQRNALLMYTSCGWFFDDISGIEPTQILRYAGRVMQLAEEAFGEDFEPGFLQILEKAPSNLPEYGDGRRVYEKWVKPSRVGWRKVAAHYAISCLFDDAEEQTTVFRYKVTRRDQLPVQAGRVKLLVGRAEIDSLVTAEAREFVYAALHLGDHNVNCGVCDYRDGGHYRAALGEIREAFERVDYPQTVRLMDHHFGEPSYTLGSLFRDRQRWILKRVLRDNLDEAERAYTRIHEEQLPLMRFLAHLDVPLPRAYRAATEFLYATDIRWALREDEPDFSHIRDLLGKARQWDVSLDRPQFSYRFSKLLGRVAERWQDDPFDAGRMELVREGAALARDVPFAVNLWKAQNHFLGVADSAYPRALKRARRGRAETLDWLDGFVAVGELLDIEVGTMAEAVEDVKQAPRLPELVRDMVANRAAPRATYRIQFHEGFTFADAVRAVPYLAKLGVSTLYASPILKPRRGSTHGYDTVDHGEVRPELGGEDGFGHLLDALGEHGMDCVLDAVPNHMGVGDPANGWWMDVLENGPHSRHADHFDIDWDPINPDLKDKVLIPILGDQFGNELEAGKIQLSYGDGTFRLHYYEHLLPVAPVSQAMVLEKAAESLIDRLGEEHDDVLELESVITSLNVLLPPMLKMRKRRDDVYREKDIIRRRLRDLEQRSPEVAGAVQRAVARFNGRPGDPESFDLLDALIDRQSYRPAFWKVATEEINYRRFFDINDLAAIRVELEEVFEATHRLFMKYVGGGRVVGLRVDHPDGLWAPTDYFRDLQRAAAAARLLARPGESRDPAEVKKAAEAALAGLPKERGEATPWALWVTAEKILGDGEDLPGHWSVAGTTGYDFLNACNGLFVDADKEADFDAIYREWGPPETFAELLRQSKGVIMRESMASEINSLAHQLDRLTERNRRYRDFTLNALTAGVREVIAQLTVYRTYVDKNREVTLRDRLIIEETIRAAKRANPRLPEAIFDFIGDTLLLKNIDQFHEGDRKKLIDWVMRFQQMTGPIMAKGVEDTTFYIYNRLTSLNEVGGEPVHFGVSPGAFHAQNAARAADWPHAMLSSSTHDTKRSEDVRARINALSEMPEPWRERLFAWGQINAGKLASIDDQAGPSPNDQYLLYQALVGAWPIGEVPMAEFRERVAGYMAKATKEAKQRTNWTSPDAAYDDAVRSFTEALLPDDADDAFLKNFREFQSLVAHFGFFNSLSQAVLKLTSPGVPDVYQGTELWDLSLVDPDNRRPVDYGHRAGLLDGLLSRQAELGDDLGPLADELLADVPDGRIKLYVTYRLLHLRRERPGLFAGGDYVAIDAGRHVCAFGRSGGESRLLVAVPRLLVGLTGGEAVPPTGDVWNDAELPLPADWPAGPYRDVFTGAALTADAGRLRLAALFGRFPVAVLTG